MLTAAESDALLLSLSIAARAVLINLPFAILVAWLLTRTRFAGRTLFDAFVHLPLVLPPVVVGYLLLVLFGARGPIGGWLHETFGVRLAFTGNGAALATAVMSFPLVVRAIRISLEHVDRGLEDAARTHTGRRRFRPFRQHHAAADTAGRTRRRGHGLRRRSRRIRRRDHLRVQHPWRDPHAAAGLVHRAADSRR
jgi:molybdate transport system permease protein